MHFLTRLSRRHGAVAAFKGGRLVFAPSTPGQSVSGQGAPRHRPGPGEGRPDPLEHARGDRDEHGSVRARWRDARAGRTRFATAGSGDPVKTLRSIFPTGETAKAAAEAELAKSQRAQKGVDLTMPGRPETPAAGRQT